MTCLLQKRDWLVYHINLFAKFLSVMINHYFFAKNIFHGEHIFLKYFSSSCCCFSTLKYYANSRILSLKIKNNMLSVFIQYCGQIFSDQIGGILTISLNFSDMLDAFNIWQFKWQWPYSDHAQFTFTLILNMCVLGLIIIACLELTYLFNLFLCSESISLIGKLFLVALTCFIISLLNRFDLVAFTCFNIQLIL